MPPCMGVSRYDSKVLNDKPVVSLVAPLVIVRGLWITTQGFRSRNGGDF